MATVKYTGSVASFHCPTNAEIRSLKVHFSPKQEGSGDPSPENVRPIEEWDGVRVEQRGKNLFYLDESKMISEGWNRFFPNPIKKSGIYSISCSQQFGGTGSLGSAIFFVDEPNNNAEHIGSALVGYSFGNTIFQVTNKSVSEEQANAKYILFGMGSSGCTFESLQNAKIQIERGPTATSYEPYPCSTTNYEFGVLGKNKFNGTIINKNIGSTGKILSADLTRLSSLYVPVSSGTYTLSSAENYPVAIYVYKENNEDSFITNESLITWNESPVTFTINEGKYINIKWKKEDSSSITVSDISNIQLELGSTATAYESYDPKHTVYGGWIDLITGEVCEEYNKITFTGEETYYDAGTWVTTFPSNLKAANSVINYCSHYIGGAYKRNQVGAMYNEKTITFDGNIRDAAGWKEYTATQYNNGTPIQLCYNLATPITYNLTPTQLQTFLGQNNIWSNADYVEVEYDLHETQDILMRKQYIMANQPHIATLPATSLQQFITDVPAPIKDCKIYFSPTQTGTGTPNPNNIMPIAGNTEANITIADYNLNNNATTTLTLPTTLYHGTIDLMTGEITQNYQLFSFDGTENWETAVFSTPGPSSRIMIWLDTISGHNNYDQHKNRPIYCSHFSYGGTASTTFGEYRYNPVSGSPPRAYFAIMDPNTEHFGSLVNFKQFLADQASNDTPVQVLIPLTVPKHYQISPITLKTLRGINNIWPNIGAISLQYWTHITTSNLLPSEYQQVEYLFRTNEWAGPYSTVNLNLKTGDILTFLVKGINISGQQAFAGNSTSGENFEFYYQNNTGALTCYPNSTRVAKVKVNQSSSLDYPDVLISRMLVDGIMTYFGVYRPSNLRYNGRIYKLTVVDSNGIIKYNFIPCYRKSDNVAGFYDIKTNTFYTNEVTTGTWQLPSSTN